MPNLSKITSNPYYLSILQNIESLIVRADKEAEAREIHINDSQVKSVLIKVRGKAKMKEPKLESPKTEKEKVLIGLIDALIDQGEYLMTDPSNNVISRKDWIISLETVIESVKRHKIGDGSREYLKFIRSYT